MPHDGILAADGVKLGLSTFTYTWAVGVPGYEPDRRMTALDLVRRASELAVPVAQFADNLPLDALSPRELLELRTEAITLGIAIEVGTRGIGEHLSRYAELANFFGALFVRVVIDRARDHPSPEEAAGRLAEYEKVFRDRGLRLAIENHDRFSTGQLAWLVSELGDWAGICLDTVNSLGALEVPAAVVKRLGPLAMNVHIKDFTIRRPDHSMGFEIQGAPAGSGSLDIPWLLSELADNEDVRTAILELWTPPEQTVAKSIAKESAWAEASLTYLRAHTELEFASQ